MKKIIGLILLIIMAFNSLALNVVSAEEMGNVWQEAATAVSIRDRLSNLNKGSVINYANATPSEITQSVEVAEKPFIYTDYVGILPTLYIEGDNVLISKDNAVELSYRFVRPDGTTYLSDGVCSLKWQGSSSLMYPKKNYTIKFPEKFVADEKWGAESKYCMKANFMDYSHTRNLGSAKLWGQIVNSRNDATSSVTSRLKQLPNGGAVDGFPIILVINGFYQGMYTFNIPKDPWMFKMGASGNMTEAIIGADAWSEQTLFKAETAFYGDFEVEHNSYEDVSEDPAWMKESLNRLLKACIESDGTDLDTTIAQYLDWDSAIDYYIFTTLIGAIDCQGKNYLLATFDGTKWFFSAYDMDTTFGIGWDGKYYIPPDLIATGTFIENAQNHRVMDLILKYKKPELCRRYWELRSGVLSEENVINTLRSVMANVPEKLHKQDLNIWNGIPGTDTNNLMQMEDWYKRRVGLIDDQVRGIESNTLNGAYYMIWE